MDDHEAPIEELRRLYGIHDQLFGKTPREQWLPVDDELRAEIDERLAELGYERLADWAGAANLEERVDGDAEIDPVVLRELRRGIVKGWEVASLTGIEPVQGPGTLQWTPLRRHLGITAFGINAYTATEAGQDVVEEHNEERSVTRRSTSSSRGRATFVLDGDEVEVPAGSLVFLRDPKVKRTRAPRSRERRCWRSEASPAPTRSRPGSASSPPMRSPTNDLDGAIDELNAGLVEKPGPSRAALSTSLASTPAQGGSTRREAHSTARSSSTPS